MREVTFMMAWQCVGKQTILLPDEIDENDQSAVEDYIRDMWPDIPIPEGDYVADSDELDTEYGFSITGQRDSDEIKVYDGYDNLPYAIDRAVKVEWENLDEGLTGDYDPEDPRDINLLRFTVYIAKDGQWVQVDDASYCTAMPANTDPEILKRAIAYLTKEYSNVLNSDPDQSVKKLGEGLSWIGPDWFTESGNK